MPKTLLRQSWTYTRCSLRQLKGRRFLATAAVATLTHTPPNSISPKADHVDPSTSADDRLLRRIFDSRSFWHDFSRTGQPGFSRPNTGLFQNHHLKHPDGFQEFAQVTVGKCRRIVDNVLQISTVEGYKTVARELDRLSDLLCRIIDLSDFVRSTHPDPAFQQAATQAHSFMFEYMNTLNITTGLCEQLQKALMNPEVVGSWSEEEKTVAQILMKDFTQSAIDLPESKRHDFVELSNAISQLGFRVVDEMEPVKAYLIFDSSRLKGMDPMTLKRLTNRRNVVHLPTTGSVAASAIMHVEDEDIRREIYVANRTASGRQIHHLEQFLRLRAELAQLSGYPSFASMTLVDKMAKSPEAVNRFLEALSAENAPRMKAELAEMLAAKRKILCTSAHKINAWDKEYLRNMLGSKQRSTSRKSDFLPAYFSLGTVMQGLSRLFSRLYGVRLVPREAQPGETWSPDVRRLDVIDETDGHIAVVYCDLFAREGKNPNPAHFTLRCSRLITASEVAEAHAVSSSPSDQTPSQLTNDGMATSYTPSGDLYQLPTIALICDFPSPTPSSSTKDSTPTLLTYRDLQTLFHEMGHAIHSILGRTKLQGVSGTRCATDFAELPSVLMEHFAANESVLGLFARHWETDAPLPYDMVREKLDRDRKGQGAEIEAQILLSALDQAYHSDLPLRGGSTFDSTAVFHDISRRWGSVPEPDGTSWQGFFGHLVGYGGSYYSYLFDRAIAGR
ncbi:MAG: hypothetical protein Q9187_007881, partial [Circinaria calcarea]